MKQYKNVILSFVFLLLTFVTIKILDVISYPDVGITYAITFPVLVFDIPGIVFAFRSMKLKESPWIGNVSGVVGVLTFIFILFVSVMVITWK